MSESLFRIAEPVATERVRALLSAAHDRLTASQRAALATWDVSTPLDRTTTTALQAESIDPAQLRALANDLARRRRTPSIFGPGVGPGDQLDDVPRVLANAWARPAVASAILWRWLAGRDGGVFAAHLVQRVRELAGLPGLHRRLVAADPALEAAGDDLSALVAALLDRQLDDACAWLEHVPPPLAAAEAAPLSRQHAAIEAMRAEAPHVTPAELGRFAQLAATFIVQLSVRGLDPVGFALGKDVELDADPPLARRIEIASWARQAEHRLATRGQMFVTAIPVSAPWPLRLELIAAELGPSTCGGLGMLLRLRGEAPVAMAERAPILLCFPGEPTEERGPRFERWLSAAYPAAARAWQAWS